MNPGTALHACGISQALPCLRIWPQRSALALRFLCHMAAAASAGRWPARPSTSVALQQRRLRAVPNLLHTAHMPQITQAALPAGAAQASPPGCNRSARQTACCCKATAHLPHGATSPLFIFSFHDLTTPPTPRSTLPLRRIRRHLHPGRTGRTGARPRGGFVGIDRS